MNHATTAHATKNDTTNPIRRVIHCSPVMCPGENASVTITPASCLGRTAFFSANKVAANMVGIETKKENSSAAGLDSPTLCPAAIVAIDRLVPGNTADRICTAPIQ